KDLHNFLVGDLGVVVHNGCLNAVKEINKDIIGDTGLKHIFHGEIKAGQAFGVHHISAVKDGTASIVSGSKVSLGPKNSGVYNAKVKVKDENGNFISKTDNDGYSTFFPDSWDELKTMDKIREAQNNIVKVISENSGTKVILGQTAEGIKIRITTYSKFNNNIYTAFPDYN
ncbi:MAG TPA: EndoU domain-containing protein, partial [Saprospiraceae bacterium]|nr:EndoU domain-containing protein [Saprospiraceae bacterium]